MLAKSRAAFNLVIVKYYMAIKNHLLYRMEQIRLFLLLYAIVGVTMSLLTERKLVKHHDLLAQKSVSRSTAEREATEYARKHTEKVGHRHTTFRRTIMLLILLHHTAGKVRRANRWKKTEEEAGGREGQHGSRCTARNELGVQENYQRGLSQQRGSGEEAA